MTSVFTWKPIETAPRDGTHFLAWSGVTGIYITAYRPEEVKGSGFGVIDSCSGSYEDQKPLMWMELPDEPM